MLFWHSAGIHFGYPSTSGEVAEPESPEQAYDQAPRKSHLEFREHGDNRLDLGDPHPRSRLPRRPRSPVTSGQACTVCASPHLHEVDADLQVPHLSGYARIAGLYGLRKDAVRRHKINGHVRPPRPPSPAPPPPAGVEDASGDAVGHVVAATAVEVLEQLLRVLGETPTDGMSPRELNVHRDTQPCWTPLVAV